MVTEIFFCEKKVVKTQNIYYIIYSTHFDLLYKKITITILIY